jgi:hypothetical protein
MCQWRQTVRVLDILLTSMLRSTRNRTRALFPNLGFQNACRRTGMHILLVWRLRDCAAEVGVCGDEFAFAFVPCEVLARHVKISWKRCCIPGLQNLSRRRTAQDARMNQPGKAHAGNVSRATENAFKVPNRLGPVHLTLVPMTP